jgi:hypothetical protein
MKFYIFIISLCFFQFNLALKETTKKITFSSLDMMRACTDKYNYFFKIHCRTDGMVKGEKITIELEYPPYASAECTLSREPESDIPGEEDNFFCDINGQIYPLIKDDIVLCNRTECIKGDGQITIEKWENITRQNPIDREAECSYPYDYELSFDLDKEIKHKCLPDGKEELTFSGAYSDAKKNLELKSTTEYILNPYLEIDGNLAQSECIITPGNTTELKSSITSCQVKCTLKGKKKAKFFKTVTKIGEKEENSALYALIPDYYKVEIDLKDCKSCFLKLTTLFLMVLLF